MLVSRRRCFGGLRSARTASRAKTWRDGETCNAVFDGMGLPRLVQ